MTPLEVLLEVRPRSQVYVEQKEKLHPRVSPCADITWDPNPWEVFIVECLGSIVPQSRKYFSRPWEVFQVHIGSLEILKSEFKVVWTSNTN